jgi:predicted lipid-binding transport protein (Tim44 family)
MGAGIAGGVIGNMLFRSLGMGGMGGMGGGYGLGGGGLGGGSGFGLIEFLLLLGVIFLLFKVFARKALPANNSTNDFIQGNSNNYGMNREEVRDDAANLMHDARPNGWSGNNSNSNYGDSNHPEIQSGNSSSGFSEGTPIDRDQAMDLFFQVQGAWTNRDLASAASVLDTEAKTFLEEELFRLKSLKQINRLENIAVRDVQAVESWRDQGKEFSTVRITANLLDFTVDETSLQVVSGSKTTPVKFEEYWTFARENGNPWKLSAIQQS